MQQQNQQQTGQQHPHPRATPVRRRANRHSNHNPAHKTYASENDVPSEPMFPIELVSPAPLTPHKSDINSPAPGSQPNNRQRGPRTGNKSRPKQVPAAPASPVPAKQERKTPPQSAVPKTFAAPAYAGATFHASPAPSSLPIPSFLAKALDSPGVKNGGRAIQEPSPPATDSEAPTPQHRPLVNDIVREESPLDIFFRADRAEKERARRASSANVAPANNIPFSPPVQPQSPQEARTLPNGRNAYRERARRPATQRNSSNGISFTELDGTPGKPMGPAFSTPYQERIRAARTSERQSSGSSAQGAPQQTVESPGDRTEMLKKFLAIPRAGNDHGQPSSPTPIVASRREPSGGSAAPQFRSPQASVPTGVDNVRQAEILHMENSLRQILRIGPRPNFSTASPVSYQSS